MPSAALQTIPQYTSAHSPTTYTSTPASLFNYAPEPSNTLVESSSSHRSRRPSDSHSPSINTALNSQQPFYAPVTTASSSAMSVPRSQPLPVSATAASSVPTSAAASSGQNSRINYPDLLGAPPIPPPRTSSNNRSHHGSNAASAPSSSERVAGSRHANDERHRGGRDRNGSRREKTGEVRAPRNGGQPPEEPSRGSGGNGTRGQTSAAQPRSDAAMETIPSLGTLVKESSTVINQVVVSDPAVRIESEQARQAGVQASPPIEGTTTTSTTTSGLVLVGSEGVDDGGRGKMRSRHDYNGNSSKRKETTFGQYILGQTLGEGEFGKVKLGWKKDGSIQVAIKLIRRETLGSNPSRLPKIYREISILRGLSHPNIVRLHEMVETDRHIGIIMEYASGGELFDYILNNRYLRDNPARRLFAQLVSGVGYLHKKGIVHRDLKLENLLLDRNRNIIITDFGFANTFDPTDELGEEIEYNLTNREFVKRMQLDKPNVQGMRRGDLMQTSCGSPCYAAPELVVSDSLYTGRKVDVWSCGVILYAMLAGYLPFDDDPANPDGDNINLLYKYIVTTSLTFPEYVSPHARDLLRRILIPDPRKRADLFEVARHSWLSEYSHIVSHVTSSTTKVSDIANTTVPPEPGQEGATLTRSASVREPPKSYQSSVPTVGGLSRQQGDISQDQTTEKSRSPRETKRRTVQVEYVAPQSQTARGDANSGTASSPSNPSGATRTRTRSNSRTAVANTQTNVSLPPQGAAGESATRRVESSKAPTANSQAATAAAAAAVAAATVGPSSLSRSVSDTAAFMGTQATTAPQSARPATGGSMASFNACRLSASYGLPVAPKVEATNAQGRLAQPQSKHHVMGAPPSQGSAQSSIGRPSAQQLPPKFNTTPRQEPPKGHKRSSTVSSIGEKLFGRSGSLFGGGRGSQANGSRQRSGKRYPPTSMKDPFTGQDTRASMDSRRSIQYGGNRKPSDPSPQSRPRRFSLLPASFSLKAFTSSSRSQTPDGESPTPRSTENRAQDQRLGSGPLQPRPRATTYGAQDAMRMATEGPGEDPLESTSYEARIEEQFAVLHAAQSSPFQPRSYDSPSAEQIHQQDNNYDHFSGPQYVSRSSPNYYDDYQGPHDSLPRMQVGRSGRGTVLQNHRKFTDAYERERAPSHHSGSSGAARKVMDFFRRRAKSRVGEDR